MFPHQERYVEERCLVLWFANTPWLVAGYMGEGVEVRGSGMRSPPMLDRTMVRRKERAASGTDCHLTSSHAIANSGDAESTARLEVGWVYVRRAVRASVERAEGHTCNLLSENLCTIDDRTPFA